MTGELSQGTLSPSRTRLRYKDVCKWDPKVLLKNIQTLETTASGRIHWRQAVNCLWLWRHIRWDKTEKKEKSKDTTPTASSNFAEETTTPVLDWAVAEDADDSWWECSKRTFGFRFFKPSLIHLKALRPFFFFGKCDWFVQIVIPKRAYGSELCLSIAKQRGSTASPM